MSHAVCLIEDDEILGEALTERFDVEGLTCEWHRLGASAIQALSHRHYGVVVSDIQLPDMTGEALFQTLRGKGIPLPPFLFITGYGAVDQAVRLLKLGAEDYLTKPFDIPVLLGKVRDLCARTTPAGVPAVPLGVSAEMKAIEAALPRLASATSTVLITGESGVGKEYVARALHRAGDAEGEQPFVPVNCGAIPETLIEAELFGHEKGAFTGALRTKRGLFEQAHGGTLFLDEIGDMPLPMQVKLLRAIQERCITRIGSEKAIPVSVRLVCATHRDLPRMVAEGEFREDLYYRINVLAVQVPPLRDRTDDILWHARAFLRDYASKGNRRFDLAQRTEQAMLGYPWPGNIRELRNTLERACVFAPSPVLTPEFLFGDAWRSVLRHPSGRAEETLAAYIATCERQYIGRVLAENDGRIADSAAALGISRKTLWEKMRKLGLGSSDSS
jgi:DNA-binding NtrC family response regulator